MIESAVLRIADQCLLNSFALMALDVSSLVCYDSGTSRVTGLREFHIAKALLEGRDLSQKVPSAWGPVHLFDLCLSFGYLDTAVALAERGVPGCTLELHHLGPFADSDEGWDDEMDCQCIGWRTCQYCCFGFPVSQGIWMRDWNTCNLCEAVDAAQVAASRPWVRRILVAQVSGSRLPFAISAEAMARLLDIAILTGNKEAAVCCARHAKLWPLRRWRSDDVLFDEQFHDWSFEGERPSAIQDDCTEVGEFVLIELLDSAILTAALSAGVDLKPLCFRYSERVRDDMPLREALALLAPSSWPGLSGLVFEGKSAWMPQMNNRLGCLMLRHISADDQRRCVSGRRLQVGKTLGLPLRCFTVPASACNLSQTFGECSLNLLEVAVLCGQADCAVTCIRYGIDSFCAASWCLRPSISQTPSLEKLAVAAAGERRSAALAAARAAFEASWGCEVATKGVALLQAMMKQLRRAVPPMLVEMIVDFCVEVCMIDQLDLWEDLKHNPCVRRCS